MICISQYSLSLMLFFIGFYIVAENIKKKKRILRITSYVFFFFSFEMNSLLFFYLIIALYVWWRENNFKKIIKTIIYYSDYILLVIIYVIIKKEYFIPSGSYSNYNSFSISRILKFPIKLIYTLYDFTIKLFSFSIFNSLKSPLIVILFIGVYFFIKNINWKDIKFNIKYLYLSFFLIFAALFPYLIVGKKPVLFGWANRHSILLGSGLAFLLYSLYSLSVQKIPNNKINKIILSLIISCFIIFNIDLNKEMLIYSYKTDSILFNLQDSEIIKSNTTFLFKDISKKNDKGLLDKSIDSFYIFNGMMHTVFNDETRFMVPDIKSYDKYKKLSKQYPFLRYSDWDVSEIQYKVFLVNKIKISGRNFYKLLFYSLFNPEKYFDLSKSLYVLEYEKI